MAEANYREYLEKTAPQGEEELQDLALKVIDNSTRGVEIDITQTTETEDNSAKGADVRGTKQKGKATTRGRGRPKKNHK